MTKFSFMVAFFIWIAFTVGFTKSWNINPIEDRVLLATILSSVPGIIVYFGIKDLTKKRV